MSGNLENNLAPLYACIESARDSAQTAAPIVPVLMGPTGSGKTGVAVEIARKFPITAIVADLRQVMRGMEIGSAQPIAEELAVLPHKLSGILDPSQDITVNDWRRLALCAIRETFEEGRIPLVLGGSGMCVKALISGEKYDAPPAPVLRKALSEWVVREGLKTVTDTVEAIISGYVRIDEFTNRQRVIRGIERYAFKTREQEPPESFPESVKSAWKTQCELWDESDGTTGEPARGVRGDARGVNCGSYAMKAHDSRRIDMENPYRYKVFALLPNREWLRKRIASRARDMFENGLLDEVRALVSAEIPDDSRALKGHGYPEAMAVLIGIMTVDEAIERTTINTARYAKRQITWLKHQMENVTWIEIDG